MYFYQIEPLIGNIRDVLPRKVEEGAKSPTPYALMLSGDIAHIENYYKVNGISPWLGQGACYVVSDSWTSLVQHAYLTMKDSSKPQGYKIKDGSAHSFSLIHGSHTNWSTLGKCTSDKATGVDVCDWSSYYGGSITVTDTPSLDPIAQKGTRDNFAYYVSNQLDISGLSMHTYWLILLFQMIHILVDNPAFDSLFTTTQQ